MRRALIIGATSAIAAEIARAQAARGDRLYLLARDATRLGALADELGDAVAGWAAADFTETARAEALVADADRALGGLDLLVVAHGLLGDQLASEADFAVAERILATNLDATVAFLVPGANLLEQRGSGAIVVLSSVAAERGRPRNYTYAAAKAALNVYLEGLRSRLYTRGVRVHTIKLGPVDTPMTATHAKSRLFAQPGPVARQILRAVDRGQAEAYVPGYWRPIMAVVRNLPEPLFQRMRALSGR